MSETGAPDCAAQRGDLAVLSQTADGRMSVTLGVVTSVTRTGLVKAWDSPFFTHSEPHPLRLRLGAGDRVLVASRHRVDVGRAMAAYRHHVYEGHQQIKPFGSIDDARGFLRAFRIESSTSR